MTGTQQNSNVAKFFLIRYSIAFQRILKLCNDCINTVVISSSAKNFFVEIYPIMKNNYRYFLYINL